MQVQNDVYGSVVLAATQMFVDERLPRMGDEALFRLLEPLGENARAARVRARRRPLGISRPRARAHLFGDDVLGGVRSARPDRAAPRPHRSRPLLGGARARASATRILAEAWNEKRGAFTGALGHPDLDASVLLISELGLLPPSDPRFVKTCDAIGRDLMRNGRVMRYVARR